MEQSQKNEHDMPSLLTQAQNNIIMNHNYNSLYPNNSNQGSNRNYDNQLKIITLKYKLLYQVDILKKHGVGVGLFVEYLDVLKYKYPSQNIINQLINNIDRNYSVFIYNLQDESLIRDLLLFFPN